MKNRSEKSVGMSGPLLTNVFALSGGPRPHKNPFARGIPPRPLLASRPARRPIDSLRPAACWTLTPRFLICFSCSFSEGPVGLLRAATPPCCAAAHWAAGPGAEAGRPGHPHRQPELPQPPAAPLPHDRALPLRQAVPLFLNPNIILVVSVRSAPVPPASGLGRRSTQTRSGAACRAGAVNDHPGHPDMLPESLSLAGLSGRPQVRTTLWLLDLSRAQPACRAARCVAIECRLRAVGFHRLAAGRGV